MFVTGKDFLIHLSRYGMDCYGCCTKSRDYLWSIWGTLPAICFRILFLPTFYLKTWRLK